MPKPRKRLRALEVAPIITAPIAVSAEPHYAVSTPILEQGLARTAKARIEELMFTFATGLCSGYLLFCRDE